MKNFALIGASGYIAPRHMKAIKDTNNNLIAAIDKFDSVGIIDSYFPNADFFTEFERFDRHISRLKFEKSLNLDYVSICTPNYLHDSHIRFALRQGAHAICEKPLVLNPWNIDALSAIQKETGKKIYNILQLRVHPSIIALKHKIENGPKDKIYDIDLTYLTTRGHWYYTSWKGDKSKSGGIATNIGVHFFDMLSFLFGAVIENKVHFLSKECASGYLEYSNARVSWFLSIDSKDLPIDKIQPGNSTYRSIKIDGSDLEFTDGFADLHTKCYEEILSNRGFGIEDARSSIETVEVIRNSKTNMPETCHPFLKKRINRK